MNAWKRLLVVCFAGALALASPISREEESSAMPIHIIKPPVRCPEGMKPDINGRCRVVWEKSVSGGCTEGKEPDGEGLCREISTIKDCYEDECLDVKKVKKRDADFSRELEEQAEAMKPFKKQRRMEALKTKKRSVGEDGKVGKRARSKHAFLIMLKKKKMQMMKPKPPPPPPHHPPHHHPPHRPPPQEQPEEEPEEEATEEPPQDPQRLFFGDEGCLEKANSTGGCPSDAEMVETPEENKAFKEWKPEKSSESSESSDSSSSSSSSSSDSTGESESEGGSVESEDEVLEKAVKIKLMKLFRMKQRYGPALRRWLATQLREYESSFGQ